MRERHSGELERDGGVKATWETVRKRRESQRDRDRERREREREREGREMWGRERD